MVNKQVLLINRKKQVAIVPLKRLTIKSLHQMKSCMLLLEIIGQESVIHSHAIHYIHIITNLYISLHLYVANWYVTGSYPTLNANALECLHLYGTWLHWKTCDWHIYSRAQLQVNPCEHASNIMAQYSQVQCWLFVVPYIIIYNCH